MFNPFKKKEAENPASHHNPDEVCITCRHVLEEDKPILYIHLDEACYSFLCGAEGHDDSEARVVGIGAIVEIDKKPPKPAFGIGARTNQGRRQERMGLGTQKIRNAPQGKLKGQSHKEGKQKPL
ncbi:MAG: hypothetical protein LBI44_04165 [Oscillospiraceae bacterium]|jgi:hypothetical protein|nr:hypothetical protein [Oscillospiraceae bacterium]